VLAAEVEVHERDFGSDHFVFGGSVRVEQPVPGDLIAAGGNVDVDAEVKGDVVAAGGNLRLAAAVGQNVYAAGGRLVIDAPVGRNLRIAGGQVELGPKGSVGGNVTAAGGQVTLRGTVKGALSASGGRVTIDGAVDGDVESNAGTLRLGPNARIGGKLRYRSGSELASDPAAQVAGGIERRMLPGQDGAASAAAERPARESYREHGRWSGPGWFWTLGLMALAALLAVALPGLSRRVADAWRMRFGWSLLWGFIALVCIPAAVLVLLISIIGIPIALLTALLYGALLIVGYAASGIALGFWGLGRWRAGMQERTGWRIGSVALAVLALALLGSVPFVGGLIGFVAVIAGIGAIAQLLRTTRPAQAA
jgi:cytoskeletal protein CcmA (bactofilin family)